MDSMSFIIGMVRCRPARHEHLTGREDKHMDLVKTLSEQYVKPELPALNVGDTVRVTVRVKEGNRERESGL
jgi:hypothetical protein